MPNKHHYLELDHSAMGSLTAFMQQMALKGKWRIRKRASAVYLSYKYRTVPEIAQDLKCSERSIYEWLARYKKDGLAGISPKSHPTKLTQEQIDEMMKISGWQTAHRSGKDLQKAWSFRKIAEWVKNKWNINISYVRIRQIIRKRARE